MKNRWFWGVLILVLVSCSAGGQDNNISGVIREGLRVITLDEGTESYNLHVYRGDYVRFLKKEPGRLIIKDMDLDLNVPMKQDGEVKYIKFKETGVIAFSLDGKKGKITVHEYVKPNYYEVNAKTGFEMIKKKSPLVLDVRTQGEYNSGHLKDSVLLPVGELQKRAGELDKYKNKPIFIYCATGNRSTVASKILMDMGFKEIYNLRRGIRGWIQDGYEIEK